MAYRLKINEPFGKGVRRILKEQIELAAGKLGDTSDPERAVHDARKHLKRIRALLRLARPAMGDAAFTRENARFREIGRSLAQARDFDVLAKTIDLLDEGNGLPLRAATRKLRACLAADREKAEASGLKESKSKARAMLQEALAAVADIKIPRGEFKLIRLGLHKTYRACQKRLNNAYSAPSDDAFHEWRKTVQHHWRHAVLLSRAWPDEMAARVEAARDLSDALGKGQDLSLLAKFLQSSPTLKLSPKERERVEQRCRSLQAELRTAARPRGHRLLAEKVEDFCDRMESYWRAARDIEKTGEAETAPQRHKAVAVCNGETRGKKSG